MKLLIDSTVLLTVGPIANQEWNTMQTNIRRQKSRVSSASILLPTSSLSSSASASSSSTGSSSSPSLFWRQKKKLLRPLLITCGVMLFARLSGAHAFNFYAVPIFRASFAGSLDAHAAAIIVAFVQLLASITSGLLIDQVGRLPLLIVSSSLMTVALAGNFVNKKAKQCQEHVVFKLTLLLRALCRRSLLLCTRIRQFHLYRRW